MDIYLRSKVRLRLLQIYNLADVGFVKPWIFRCTCTGCFLVVTR